LETVVEELRTVVERNTGLIDEMAGQLQVAFQTMKYLEEESVVSEGVATELERRIDVKDVEIDTLKTRVECLEERLRQQAEENRGLMATAPEVEGVFQEVGQQTIHDAVEASVQTDFDVSVPIADVVLDAAVTNEASAGLVAPPLEDCGVAPPIPVVNVQDATPQTSQEAAQAEPTAHLAVPASQADAIGTTSRPSPPTSRHSSPVPTLRRSPRLRSPSPSPTTIPSKRHADTSGDESTAKKRKED
jgi:hypothetical protein